MRDPKSDRFCQDLLTDPLPFTEAIDLSKAVVAADDVRTAREDADFAKSQARSEVRRALPVTASELTNQLLPSIGQAPVLEGSIRSAPIAVSLAARECELCWPARRRIEAIWGGFSDGGDESHRGSRGSSGRTISVPATLLAGGQGRMDQSPSGGVRKVPRRGPLEPASALQ